MVNKMMPDVFDYEIEYKTVHSNTVDNNKDNGGGDTYIDSIDTTNLDESQQVDSQSDTQRQDNLHSGNSYTIEDMERELSQLKNERDIIADKIHRLKGASKINLLKSPNGLSVKFNTPLSITGRPDWISYKYQLRSAYDNLCRDPQYDKYIYIVMLIISAVIAIKITSGLVGYIYTAGDIISHILCQASMTVLLTETISGIVSTIYYVILPNKKLAEDTNVELDKLSKELKNKEDEIELYNDMINTSKVTAIRPSGVIRGVKNKTNETMLSEVRRIRSEVESNIEDALKIKFMKILDELETLLSVCGSNSNALNDISNIYNVVLEHTFLVAEKYQDTDLELIVDLLDNFDKYVNSKISKHKTLHDMSLLADINTLNNIFKGDC